MSYNKYDCFLFILILSLATGSYGGARQTIYIFAILFVPALFSYYSHDKVIVQKCVILLAIMAIYSFFSLLWTMDSVRGLSHLKSLFFNSLIVVELFSFSMRAKKPVLAICYGWLWAFLATSIIAIWEITTDHHLSISRQIDIGGSVAAIAHNSASVAFYNPNTYSLFVTLSLPFILYVFSEIRKRIHFIFSIFALLLLVYILLMNGSRGAIIAGTIMFIMYFIFVSFKGANRTRYYMLYTICVFSPFAYMYGSSLMEYISYRSETQGMFEDAARLNLWDCSWNLFLDSNGIGKGIGSMMKALRLYSGNITLMECSHNLFLELLLEGGVIWGAFFVYLICKIFHYSFNTKNATLKMYIYAVVVPLPFYSIINSIYFNFAFIWCFFSSAVIISSSVFGKYTKITNNGQIQITKSKGR